MVFMTRAMCQKAQDNLAKVSETGSTWEFHIPRIDTWGYLAHPFGISNLWLVIRLLLLSDDVRCGVVKNICSEFS